MKKLLILLGAVALIVAFTLPATAADEIKWNWYGNARVFTFWTSDDYNQSGTTVGGDDDTKDSQLQWNLGTNSAIGFRVKGGPVGGRVEIRSGSDAEDGGSSTVSTNWARIWGSWDFGAGTLYVGKRQGPINSFISGQIYNDTGLVGWGSPLTRRRAQIALGFGGFEVAFIQPSTPQLSGGTGGGDTDGDKDPYIPKVEARWGMGFDTWNFNLMGGFQTYKLSNVTAVAPNTGTNDVDVTSYLIAGDMGMNFGPFYTKAGLYWGQNMGPADWIGGSSPTFDGDDDTKDVDTYGGVLVLGFKMTDMVTFEGGVGGIQESFDRSGWGDSTKYSAYVQAVMQMYPGVFFIPEFSYFNTPDTGNGSDEGTSTWALGGKWQINF
jgi:hypothetical protein